MPVIHQGYLNFITDNIDRQKDSILLLGDKIIEQLPVAKVYVERDIRKIHPEFAVYLLKKRGCTVSVMSQADMNMIQNCNHVCMPDEDISHEFAEVFKIKASFKKMFLRWDKIISQKLQDIANDEILTDLEFHQRMMKLAYDTAEKSIDWWRQVGSVILTKDGRMINGVNTHFPKDSINVLGDPRSNFNAGERIDLSTAIHAEAQAIATAASEGYPLKGASIYVTTFPCPGCAKLIVSSGIKHVYYHEGYSLLDAQEVFKQNNVSISYVK